MLTREPYCACGCASDEVWACECKRGWASYRYRWHFSLRRFGEYLQIALLAAFFLFMAALASNWI